MKKRKLGYTNEEVSSIGLGCMGMSFAYGKRDDEHSVETLHKAIELGVDFWDTSDMYGFGHNEELISKVLKTKRKDVFLATKFGFVLNAASGGFGLDCSPKHVKEACEASLKRLGTDTIDLYYAHRVDPKVPIEETVTAMAELVKEGKVRYLGLSEASAATLEKASKIHPIAALQSEYSLWSRELEEEIIPKCQELNVCLVAYSPLGRGFLSGEIKKFDDFEKDDYRRMSPRFQGDNFDKNLELVNKITDIAKRMDKTASQVALAWTLSQGEHIIPIPGTKRIKYLIENTQAEDIILSKEVLDEINQIFPMGAAAGLRYPEMGMKMVNL